MIKELENLGIIYYPVNISQIKNVLRNLNLTEQFLAKLRGTWISIEGDRAEAGPLLKNILELYQRLEEEAGYAKNFSEWKRYFEDKRVLQKIVEDGH